MISGLSPFPIYKSTYSELLAKRKKEMYDSDLYLSLRPEQSEFKIKIDEAAKQNSGHFDPINEKI